jgi:APA family basic amino acid/polyamine antiporter
LFDASMIVMGGIIGSGIFINPYVVAQRLHSASLILLVWAFGGAVALAGAFVYAELGSRKPEAGGQYAYIREAYHPSIAFLYGWTLLLVVQTGGMAAVALTFSRYFLAATSWSISDGAVAAIAILLVTAVNCLGVRAGSSLQNVLMVLKIGAIAALIVCGVLFARPLQSALATPGGSGQPGVLAAFGAALIPVLFAYGGWQTVNFIAGEVRDPGKNLPRGLILGVCGVVILYLAVNFVCLRVLGAAGLGATTTPASRVMEAAFGQTGSRFIATGVAISTLGFLSQGMLTAPRVYYAMADDGLFFRSVSRLHPRTQAPVFAIVLQGVLTFLIALSGRYEQILNYVVSSDFIFFGLTGTCVFVLRHRGKGNGGFRIPGHPWTTFFFIAACWLVVVATVYNYPLNSLIGFAIILSGLPVYLYWSKARKS